MSRTERSVLSVLAAVLVISGFLMLRQFYVQSSIEVPKVGGTYIEGAVGEVTTWNPWFSTGNGVDRDVSSLIFSGLMKYDPKTKEIVDDLAEVKVSSDRRTYTATLKPNLFWHDSTDEFPHPVTTDDVVFTFQTTQEQGFQNPILAQNFRGVDIEKIDEETVRFRLDQPYAFFTSNLTLGLVPASSFAGKPIESYRDDLDFLFQPVGAGPYKFVSTIQTEISTEVTLEQFEREGMPEYFIERVVFRIFPDYTTLLTDILNLDGIRQVPRNEQGDPILPSRFTPLPYSLPQYVGLFFNMDRPIVADPKVRLGLQLATNKQEIVDTLHETNIVDTGLLELDLSDWRYKFDAGAAQGAFFDSNWNVPEKVRLQRLLEQRESNRIGYLSNTPRIALLQTGALLTITGSTQDLDLPVFVNDVQVQTGVTLKNGTVRSLSGTWIVQIPTGNGLSGSLKVGFNALRMNDADGDVIDSAFMMRYTDRRTFAKASEEYQMVEAFLRSKSLNVDDPDFVGISQLAIEDGFLRRRKDSDEIHTRINDRGDPLKITLLTSNRPSHYETIAEIVQAQWEAVGADVTIDIPETRQDFEEKLVRRQYDVVLFGQSLFDNLDTYPYWHSSQIQENDNDEESRLKLDAFNLSQYASFDADKLLEVIRTTSDTERRAEALEELSELLKTDIPAITLYSPLSVFAHGKDVQGVETGHLALHADRLARMHEWYIDTERTFVQNRTWLSLPKWILSTLLGR